MNSDDLRQQSTVGAREIPKDVALREFKWKELETRMGACRFYIQLILGVNGFYYAMTGAVILFALKGGGTIGAATSDLPAPVIATFLLLPVLMGVVVGGFMIYAVSLQMHSEIIIDEICEYLKIREIPDLGLLRRLLLVFGSMFFIVAFALSFVLFFALRHQAPSISVWASRGACAVGVVIVICGFLASRWASRQYWRTNLYWRFVKLLSF